MHLAPLIIDLAIILGVAGIVTLLFHRIRQPVVLGYIVAGVLIGPHTPSLPTVSDVPNIQIWAEIGVIFLMFSLGLEFSFRKLARVGSSASVTATVEAITMISLGYGCGRLFGWSTMDSVFLGAMLSISSTTIIIKALDELGLKTHRFAELIFGALIVEDLIAILLLVGLTTFAVNQSFSGLVLLTSGAKLILVVGGWFLVGYFVLPRFVRYVSRRGTEEMLTTVSLGLCFALVVAAASFGYSVALGAFIMGSILAETPESHRIEELLSPLKNVFAAIFFVSVGMLMDPYALWTHIIPVTVISLVTIFGKIISTSGGALLSGQPLGTSVRVGFGLAQIGEFSFIIASLGMSLGVTSDFIYPIGVAVSVITTFTTPYLIRFSLPVAEAIEARLPLRTKVLLARYSSWRQESHANHKATQDFRARTMKWLVNGLVMTIIFTLAATFIQPSLEKYEQVGNWRTALTWVIAVLLSSPFFWAMFSSFKGSEFSKDLRPAQRGLLLLTSRLLALLWMGLLSVQFLKFQYAVALVVILVAAVFNLLYRRLETTYHWFERGFLSTFEEKETSGGAKAEWAHLAPWDAHLVTLKVHPNAPLASKTLLETELRKKFGINVVAIQRGLVSVVAPKPEERVLPADELLVLGTDEQVEAIRPLTESPWKAATTAKATNQYKLSNFLLAPRSPLAGQSIRQAKIRERYNCMVVGVERNHQRMMNPDTDLPLEEGDILWVVGEEESLSKLRDELRGHALEDSGPTTSSLNPA